MRTTLWFTAAVLAMKFFTSSLTPAEAASPAAPREPVAVEPSLPPPPSAEVLAKIKAPAVTPIIKTKGGYTIKVDPSQQILSIYYPKKEEWISPDVRSRQTVEVTTEGASLKSTDTVLAKLKKGQRLYTTDQNGDWVKTQVLSGNQVLSGWVQKKNLKPLSELSPPQKNLTRNVENFASASMLIQKGKQFDDGLYATVELAMRNGLGSVAGKKTWLPRLAAKVDASTGGVPLAQLYAALRLGGDEASPPSSISRTVDAELKEFQADEKRSKPLGFYNWSNELEQIFRQDRMLQSPVNASRNAAAVTAMAKQLAADEETRASYELAMRLNERLTNKLTGTGYRTVLASLDAGEQPKFPPGMTVSLLPPSRSHEADLVMKLYGNSPIPPGFDLMKEVIARLKSGQLSFQPQPDSGWYDHQLWSLEPLVRFSSTTESKQLRPNEDYLKHLEELFKGTYALMRETHVKQLEHPAPASAAIGDRPVKEREKVFLQPDPHVELLPTMYLRRAESYHYVRKVLEDAFGSENLSQLNRLTAKGPVEMNLAAELDLLERLFAGAYVVACREIGMPVDLPQGIGGNQSVDDQADGFVRWVASLASDADLAPDARMMVPVFYDQQRRKLKVWVMLGWEETYSAIGYNKHPEVTIAGPDGQPATGEDAPEIIFQASSRQLATPVFAEVYVNRLLNRAEFRKHCDTYLSQEAILANLE